jgi:26S proteasome non-ATPase regulatory subunit 9
MGFTLPSTSPAEIARSLMARKEAVEAEINAQISILKDNSSTLHSPLIDPEGFPRADIDIYAVRNARVRIIELKNDLEALMTAIGKALEGVYVPMPGDTVSSSEVANTEPETSAKPFAKVDGVAPGSPAAAAVCVEYSIVMATLK